MSYFPQLDADDLPIRQVKRPRMQAHLDDLLRDTISTALGLSNEDEQGQIKYPWTDPKTGLTQEIKEPAVKPPQGNFAPSQTEMDAKWKLLHGQPLARVTRKLEEELLPENRKEDTDIQQAIQEQERSRASMMRKIKQDNLLMTHREKMPDKFLDREDLERIPDTPAEIVRPSHVQEVPTTNLRGRHDETISPPKTFGENAPQLGNAGRHKVFDKTMVETSLLKRDNLQVAQVAAFRGLFGHELADRIVMASSSDRKPKHEIKSIVHSVIESGLLAGTTRADSHEGPLKQDTLAQNLGRRAMDGIASHSTVPEQTELPLAQRDLVALAMGRTIIHMSEQLAGFAPEMTEPTKRAQYLLALSGQAEGPQGAMSAAQIEASLRHEVATDKSKGRAVEGHSTKVITEIQEKARRNHQTTSVPLLVNTTQTGTAKQADLVEAAKKLDLMLKDMLRKPLLAVDQMRNLLKPEILVPTLKKEAPANLRIANADMGLSGLDAATEMVVAKKKKTDFINQRPLQPVHEMAGPVDTTPPDIHKVPRDVSVALAHKSNRFLTDDA